MPKVSLRVYNREIESLISRGQTEEAIAHCKYILKQFPKHIDTYRLLGKAYLESQRYTEAADIMQRVLSVVPDDFVSQLGMGIIREDEGNLDAAIWHIERAFEIQPTNKAVQDELRRLYGRRDGSEPARIRNTRGALVRLYARGELYNQAIAEARAALAEDPRRIDLEIILARMYYLSGKKVEATEVCGRLIQRLPFCYEANRILAEILPTTSRADDARVYQQNINALDPYAAFLTATVRTTDQVPDNAVMLERLEYIPAQTSPDQPAWAQTVGVQLDEESSETPDWLIAPPGETPTAPPLAEESTREPIANTEDAIPDWMKTAGWQPSTGAEEPVSFLSEEELTDGGSLGAPVAANIPDWLKEMAPPAEDQFESGFVPDAANPKEDDQLKALESLLGEANPGEETPQAPSQTSESHSDLPDWFSAITEDNAVPAQDDLPAWLKPQDADLSPTDSAPFELSEASADPDFLTAETKAAPAAEPEPMADLPDWLKSDDSQSLMDAFAETSAETPPASLLESSESAVESLAGDLPDWIAPVDEVAPAKEYPVEPQELPEWLRQVEAEEPAAEIEGEAPFISTQDLGLEPAPKAAALSAGEDLPEWLRESAPAEDEIEAAEPIQDAFTPLEGPETPTFESLPEVIPPSESLTEEDIAENTAENENVQPAPAAAEDMDEAFAWLESLAARQGAEEGLLLNPEDRHSETPEWLQAAESELPPAAETVSISEESLDLSQGLPASLESPVESVEEEMPTPPTATAEPTVPAAETTVPASADEMDSAFAWLESLAARQGAEEGLQTNPQDQPVNMPEWLQGEAESSAMDEAVIPQGEQAESTAISAEAEPIEAAPSPFIEVTPVSETHTEEPSEEAGSPVSPLLTPNDSVGVPEDLDSAFAWLENLAERQGAQEGLLLQPENRLETPPTWVEEASAEQPPEETPAPTLEDTAPVRVSPQPFAAVEEPAVVDEISNALAEPFKEEIPPEAPLEVEAAIAVGSPAELTPTEEELPPLPDWLKGIEEETDSALQAAPPLETAFVEAPAAPVQAPFAEIEEITASTAEVEGETPLTETSSTELPAQEIPSTEAPGLEAPVESIPAAPRTAAVQVQSTLDPDKAHQLLAQARSALDDNQVEAAVETYTQLIQSGANLDEVTQDLKTALFRYPMQIELYQALGDAYLKTDRLQEALDTFTKAEELLR